MTQFLLRCATAISIPFFAAACGGGSGDSSGQDVDPIVFSVVDPTPQYNGTREFASLSEETTHEVIEDIVFVSDFFNQLEDDLRYLKANADEIPLNKPKKHAESCEVSGSKEVVVERRNSELIVQYAYNQCLDADLLANGQIQQKAGLEENGEMTFSMSKLSLGPASISGNFFVGQSQSKRVANVLFEAAEETLFLENMPLPYAYGSDISDTEGGLDYSKVPSTNGRMYYSEKGYVEVALGDGVVLLNESDLSGVNITRSVIQGANGGSAEFAIGPLSAIAGEEFTDNWRSTISIQLEEQSGSTPKYFFAGFSDWYTWDETQSSDAEPSIDLMESNSDLNTLNRSVSATSVMVKDHRFLTFEWRLVHQPAISNTVSLKASDNFTATISADVAGYYYLGLRISDGKGWSEEIFRRVLAGDLNQVVGETVYSQVVIERDSSLADVSDQHVVGFPVQLKSSALVWHSDVNTTSQWSLIEAPEGSTTGLPSITGDELTFIPDVPGLYRLRLKVFSPNGFVSEADQPFEVKSTDEVKPTVVLANNFNDAGIITENLHFFDRPKFETHTSLSEISNVAWSIIDVPATSSLAGLSGNSTDLFLPVDFDVPGRYVIGYTPSNAVFTGEYTQAQYFAVDPSTELTRASETEMFAFPVNHAYSVISTIHAADFNGDGLEDILAVIDGSTPISRVHFQSADGSFLPHIEIESSYPHTIVDIDDDGAAELLDAHWTDEQTTVSGYANGQMGIEHIIPKQYQLAAVQMVDINGDGLKDIFNTHGSSPSFTDLFVHINQGGYLFGDTLELVPSQELKDYLTEHDYFGDAVYGIQDQPSGKPLLISAAPENSEENAITLVGFEFDEATQTLQTAFLRTLTFSGPSPRELSGLLDMDGDGRLDLVGYSDSSQATTIYYDVLSEANPVGHNVDLRSRYIQIEDYDGNGLMDIASRSAEQKKIVLQSSPREFTSGLFWPIRKGLGYSGPEVNIHFKGRSHLSSAFIDYSENGTEYKIGIAEHSAFMQ